MSEGQGARVPRKLHAIFDDDGNPTMVGTAPFLSLHGGSIPMIEMMPDDNNRALQIARLVTERDVCLALLKEIWDDEYKFRDNGDPEGPCGIKERLRATIDGCEKPYE